MVLRKGATRAEQTPKTDKVKFKYVKTFKLLGLNIDNKLLNIEDNFNERTENIRQKISI
jgi:hypothetical protein